MPRLDVLVSLLMGCSVMLNQTKNGMVFLEQEANAKAERTNAKAKGEPNIENPKTEDYGTL